MAFEHKKFIDHNPQTVETPSHCAVNMSTLSSVEPGLPRPAGVQGLGRIVQAQQRNPQLMHVAVSEQVGTLVRNL